MGELISEFRFKATSDSPGRVHTAATFLNVQTIEPKNMHLCLKLWSISLPSITKGNNKLNSCVFRRWGERGSSCHQGSTGFITEQVRFDHLHPNLPSLPSKISNQSFTQDMLSATWRYYFNDDLSGRLVIEGKYWFFFFFRWFGGLPAWELNWTPPVCSFWGC